MRCPLIATASAIVKPSSTVTILPFTNIVSAGSAANADATAEIHSAARTRIAFFTERFSERVGSEAETAKCRSRGEYCRLVYLFVRLLYKIAKHRGHECQESRSPCSPPCSRSKARRRTI